MVTSSKAPRSSLRWILVLVLAGTLACQRDLSEPTSDRSFDEVCRLIRGKSAAEVTGLLGAPDTRQKVFGDDERWIWWRYTFLDGPDHPPELRGRTVHLEIVFHNPGSSQQPPDYSKWTTDEVLGVTYRLPGAYESDTGR